MSTLKVDTYLTRGGASEIAIDKLKGASSAGSMTVVGEGGSTTTKLQQGLVKHFATIQGTDTFGAYNSFNMSTATDHGGGDHSTTMTNPFSDARFARNVYTHNTANEGSSAAFGANRAGSHTSGNGGAAPTTTVFRFNTFAGASSGADGALVDLSYNYLIAVGELA